MRKQLILLLAAGALAISFTIIRPRPDSAIFWIIVGVGTACLVANSIIDRKAANRDVMKYKMWQSRFSELVDIEDFEDDGHLNEWFTDSEWEAIFQKLESMPKGSRSIRTAIESIKPEIRNENRA